MILLKEQILAPRSLADCFRYLRDFSTIEQWDPGVYRAVKKSAGPPGLGTEFDLILNSGGRRIPIRYELTECIDGERLVLRGKAEGFSVEDTIRFRSCGPERTQIDYEAQINFDGILARAEWVMRPWLNRAGKAALRGLERALAPEHSLQPSLSPDVRVWPSSIPSLARRFTEAGYLAMERKSHSTFMDGQTVVVTGPTSGLGLAAASEFARLGARIVLVGRDPQRLLEAAKQVVDGSGCHPASVERYEADLSLVREAVQVSQLILRDHPEIRVLVHNAGALFNQREVTSEGYEKTLALMLLSPSAITETLMPSLRRGRARVITVSSGGMYLQGLRPSDWQSEELPYDGAKTYARTKRALVDLTQVWAQVHQDSGMTFNSMHPGWAATPGVARSLPKFNRLLGRSLRDSRMGCDTVVWLGSSSAVANLSGRFWFDRRPYPTELFPGTAVSAQQRTALLKLVKEAHRVAQ